MSKRPCLLPQSRGGLMLYNWAVENPSRVACIAGIYTVCDLRSYPGLERACGAYNMSAAELQAHLGEHNPIDRLGPLAKAAVPILHVHGDADTVVPLEKNSGELQRRYRDLGGPMRLIVVPGKGHQVCPPFFQCQELVDFVAAAASPAKACQGSVVARRPLPRETELARPGSPAAVILVPDEPEYRELGQRLAAAIAAKTGLRLSVERAADYVARRRGPSSPSGWTGLSSCWASSGITPSWSDFTPVISIPSTPCSLGRAAGNCARCAAPSVPGHNCIVVTGSDLAGCRRRRRGCPP